MSERFAQRMQEPAVRKDTRLLGDFAAIYCRGNHSAAVRSPLVSDGAELGVYGGRLPSVCDECAELLRYAEVRRAYCPRDPKPFCSDCDTHCYRPEQAAAMRDVMRYAGPRSLLSGHALEGIRHVIEARKRRKELARVHEQGSKER